jgi:hypothetical protein
VILRVYKNKLYMYRHRVGEKWAVEDGTKTIVCKRYMLIEVGVKAKTVYNNDK